MGKKRCNSHEEDFDTISSSSSKFGRFLLHTMFCPKYTRKRKHLSEHALMIITSESDHPEKYISRSRSRPVTGDCITGSNDEQLVLKVKNLGFPKPYEFNASDKLVVGSCNGLVCLKDRRSPSCIRGFPCRPHEVSLWNPATGQFRILPQAKTFPGDHPYQTIGVFGFDVKTQDYKVVLFTGLYPKWNGNGPEDVFCRVQMYSLLRDTWKLLEGIPCLPGFPCLSDDSIYLNDNCLFLARYCWTDNKPCIPENDRFIISFDLTTERVTPIQLPDHDRYQELLLCNYLGDKVALFATPNISQYTLKIRTHEDCHIWVSDYEPNKMNKHSWTKKYSFRPGESYIPRGISTDGKYALLESPADGTEFNRKMNLYNLATKEVERNFLPCYHVMSAAIAYQPTQVSVNRPSSHDWRHSRDGDVFFFSWKNTNPSNA